MPRCWRPVEHLRDRVGRQDPLRQRLWHADSHQMHRLAGRDLAEFFSRLEPCLYVKNQSKAGESAVFTWKPRCLGNFIAVPDTWWEVREVQAWDASHEIVPGALFERILSFSCRSLYRVWLACGCDWNWHGARVPFVILFHLVVLCDTLVQIALKTNVPPTPVLPLRWYMMILYHHNYLGSEIKIIEVW